MHDSAHRTMKMQCIVNIQIKAPQIGGIEKKCYMEKSKGIIGKTGKLIKEFERCLRAQYLKLMR